jgi:plastocyanin domain-containing protein
VKRIFTLWVVLAFLFLAADLTVAQSEPYRAKVDADGVQRVEMVGGDYYFKPNHIIVKANTPVELSIRRETAKPHNFVLTEPEAGLTIEQELSKDFEKISFTPTTPGRYTFYCGKKLLFLESHQERGMHGILEVIQ